MSSVLSSATKTGLLVCLLILFTSCNVPDKRAPADARQTVAALNLRRNISAENPMIVYNFYFGTAAEKVAAFYYLLPADVRPYFALQLVPQWPVENTPENREWLTSMVDAAKEVSLPVLIQAEAFNTRSDIPRSFYDDLFERYSNFVGLSFAELSASNLTLTGMDADQIQRAIRAIETVSAHDGLFMWQDMGYETEHVFLQAGADRTLFDTIATHAANVILIDKHNGRSKRFVGPAAALGFYLAGYAGNWGVNSEDWLWWEAGYGRLFEPSSGQNRSADDWKSVFSFPDALFGIDWLVAAGGGATVFSLEAPFHGFVSFDFDKLTPAFENVILPLIRQLVEYRLIPTREKIMEKTKVAYRPLQINPPELDDDRLFRGLYGPEISSLYEWLPSTGRYYTLPILPMLAEPRVDNLFDFVFDSDYYAGNLSEIQNKIDAFASRYPALGEGSSWFVNYGNHWLIANPHENEDIATSFEFALTGNPGGTVSGNLPAHSFAVLRKEASAIGLHLSNYRIDSDTDVWPNAALAADDPATYVRDIYCNGPSDDQLRSDTMVFKGLFAQQPQLQIEGSNGFSYDEFFNDEDATYTLTISHNGPVEIMIGW